MGREFPGGAPDWAYILHAAQTHGMSSLELRNHPQRDYLVAEAQAYAVWQNHLNANH